MKDYSVLKLSDIDDSNDYLEHWGVKGQKWGVRRYQNEDGTLTEAGKKRYAFQTGKDATILGQATRYSTKKLDKAREKYNKKPTEKNLRNKELYEAVDKDIRTKSILKDMEYKKAATDIGKEPVFDKEGFANARIHTNAQLAGSALVSGLSVAAVATGVSHIGIVSIPKGRRQLGKEYYKKAFKTYQHLKLSDIDNKNKGMTVALTSEEAKRLGLNDSTRIKGDEEMALWREIYRQQTGKSI